jgi:Mn2+/Fe2+ NRAMP family transporter
MQQPKVSPARRRRLRWAILVSALGPGVLGLMADNDAGGMTSYLLTGARHQLLLFVPALAVMGGITVFVQDMGLRLALGGRRPFSRLLRQRFGRGWAELMAGLLHGLNLLILATEISGMSLGLALAGLPFLLSAAVSAGLVAVLVGVSRYRTLERVLLLVALLNGAFLLSLFALHPGPRLTNPWLWAGSWHGTMFYLLALAGNAMAPWMVYWQQDAVVARGMQAWELRRGRFDLLVGVLAQIGMAMAVMWLGASVVSTPQGYFNPLVWLSRGGGRWAADLFAVGLFDAGLLAATTIITSSSWMLRAAFRPLTTEGRRMFWRHRLSLALPWASLVLATLLVVVPPWSQGFLAVLTQALAGLLMPLTLALLGILSNDSNVAGRFANRLWQRWTWPLVLGLFLGLSAAAWVH